MLSCVKFPAIFLVFLQASLSMRAGVIKIGTPIPATLKRISAKALENCPEDFPVAFDQGRHCCKSRTKKNDTSLAPDCDGGGTTYVSSKECCLNDLYVECPDQTRGCNHFYHTDKCYPYPYLIYHDDPYAGNYKRYDPDHTLFFYEECEIWGQNYYITRDKRENNKFIWDFTCNVAITELLLRNTQNGHIKDRGTKNFTMEISYDNQTWNMVLEDMLPRAEYEDSCLIPFHHYPLSIHGRYVRLTMVDYYKNGAGFNYIEFKYS